MRTTTRRFRPALEILEDRLTPTNVSASVMGTTLIINKTAPGDDSLTITKAANFPSGSPPPRTASRRPGSTRSGTCRATASPTTTTSSSSPTC